MYKEKPVKRNCLELLIQVVVFLGVAWFYGSFDSHHQEETWVVSFCFVLLLSKTKHEVKGRLHLLMSSSFPGDLKLLSDPVHSSRASVVKFATQGGSCRSPLSSQVLFWMIAI